MGVVRFFVMGGRMRSPSFLIVFFHSFVFIFHGVQPTWGIAVVINQVVRSVSRAAIAVNRTPVVRTIHFHRKHRSSPHIIHHEAPNRHPNSDANTQRRLLPLPQISNKVSRNPNGASPRRLGYRRSPPTQSPPSPLHRPPHRTNTVHTHFRIRQPLQRAPALSLQGR